ncbi:unnamed protein product [Brassica oleracea]
MQWFYPMKTDLAYTSVVLLPKFLDKDSGFLVNNQVKIVVEVDALQDIPVETEKTEEKDVVLLKEGSSIMESIDVNGFHVFRSQNQHVRSACMSSLLGLIQTLCKSLQELSNEDLIQADIALKYVKDAGDKLQYRYVRRKRKMEEGGTREKGENGSLKEDYASSSGSKAIKWFGELLAMDLIEDSDGRLDHMERSAVETEKTVKVIYEGWRKLKEANAKLDERVGAVESRLGSVEFQLQKITAAIDRIGSNTTSSKPHVQVSIAQSRSAGFKVDWLEKNLEQVKEKKLKELSGLAMLQETEEKAKKLKRKFEELDALAEEQKKELLATRTSRSFDDVV